MLQSLDKSTVLVLERKIRELQTDNEAVGSILLKHAHTAGQDRPGRDHEFTFLTNIRFYCRGDRITNRRRRRIDPGSQPRVPNEKRRKSDLGGRTGPLMF